MFWWKAIHNGLPVIENLNKRGCRSSDLCPVCGEEIETLDHMMIWCRVASEIWSISLQQENNQLSQSCTIYDLLSYCLHTASKDRSYCFPFFLGWRIWKARNKLVFENKRDHITQIVNAAVMDSKIWKEALTQNKETEQTVSNPLVSSVQEILPQHTELYCIVDASWKAPMDNIGIGWSLYCREGTLILQGSSAMNPTSTPLVAEAMAMWTAVQQLYRLYYANMFILSDCLRLISTLHCVTKGRPVQDICHPEVFGVAEDIEAVATKCNFSFRHAPRNLLDVVDKLVKDARIGNKPYVITWLNSSAIVLSFQSNEIQMLTKK